MAEAIRPTTRVLISESPTNPYNYIVDLERFADIGRRHRVKTLIDATFATPLINGRWNSASIWCCIRRPNISAATTTCSRARCSDQPNSWMGFGVCAP